MGIHKSFCVEDWPSAIARRAYSIVVFVVQFCLPLFATAGLYMRIYSRLKTRRAARWRLDTRRNTTSSSTTTGPRSVRPETIAVGGKTRSGQKSPVSGGRQGRTSRLLALIIVNFVAFWLPWNVLSLVVEFDRTAVPVDLFRLLDLGLKVLAMAGSACVNPILYCWSNDNIRGELVASISQKFGGRPHRRMGGHRSVTKQPPTPAIRRSIQKDIGDEYVFRPPTKLPPMPEESPTEEYNTRKLANATIAITTATTAL